MRNILATAAAACAMSLALPAAAQDNDHDERSDEAFAELIEGRVAGENNRCIYAPIGQRLRVVENVGLAYRDGKTLWVARARNARNIDAWDVPIIERFGGSRLCTTDVNRTIDRNSGMFSGVLFLDDFVAYREIDDADG